MTEKLEKKKHWIACRATPGCEGKEAMIVFKRSAAGFNMGTTIRYTCLTCNRPFHITY